MSIIFHAAVWLLACWNIILFISFPQFRQSSWKAHMHMWINTGNLNARIELVHFQLYYITLLWIFLVLIIVWSLGPSHAAKQLSQLQTLRLWSAKPFDNHLIKSLYSLDRKVLSRQSYLEYSCVKAWTRTQVVWLHD